MKKLKALLTRTEATISMKELEAIIISLFTYRKLSMNSDIIIDEGNNYSDWLNMGVSFHYDNVITSFHALFRNNPTLNPDDFKTIQECTSKLGSTTTKASKVLTVSIWTLIDVPLDTPEKEVFKIFKKSLK